MGGGESKPEHVPWTLHLYVTNQTKGVKQVFVRVRGDKLKESEMYSRIMEDTSIGLEAEGQAAAVGKDMAGAKGSGKFNYHNKHEKEQKERRIYANLTQGGFSHLPPDMTLPFPAENDDHLMYVSIHDGDKMWYTDMAVDPKSYGCITIKGGINGISLDPSNPEPRWIAQEKTDSPLPSTGLVEVTRKGNGTSYYLGKATWTRLIGKDYVLVCEAWREDGKLCVNPNTVAFNKVTPESKIIAIVGLPFLAAPYLVPVIFDKVSLLSVEENEYKWVKAVRGNPVPPNAVKMSIEHGSSHVCLGRVNGDRACGITEVDNKFDQFIAIENMFGGDDVAASSGEILLLTAEPQSP